jgi:hypothetical protein
VQFQTGGEAAAAAAAAGAAAAAVQQVELLPFGALDVSMGELPWYSTY